MHGELQQVTKKQTTEVQQMYTTCGGKNGSVSRQPHINSESAEGTNTSKGKITKIAKDLGAIPKTQIQLDDFF